MKIAFFGIASAGNAFLAHEGLSILVGDGPLTFFLLLCINGMLTITYLWNDENEFINVVFKLGWLVCLVSNVMSVGYGCYYYFTRINGANGPTKLLVLILTIFLICANILFSYLIFSQKQNVIGPTVIALGPSSESAKEK